MTTTEATKLDLQVLSYCHFAVMPLPHLLRKDVDCCLNMPHHGLGRDAFYDELLKLVEREWIELRYGPRVSLPIREMDALRATGWVEPKNLPDDEVMAKDAAARILRAARTPGSYLARHIRLTLAESGGAIWEQFAKPRWHLFVDQDGPEIVDDCVQFCLRTVTRRMVDLVRDLLQQRAPIIAPGDCFNISEIGPWVALPWKNFKRGYALRIDTQAKIGTARGEAYRAGLVAEEGPAADLVNNLCSLWDLEFRGRLRELRMLPATFKTYLR